MLDIYQEYVHQYKKEYGERVIVLCQVGSFYELYDDGTGLVDMKVVSELLQIQVTRRNKAILEVNRSNHLMCGFPDYTLQKFLNILVDNNYTVVVVSQVSPPPRPKRAVTQIVSPGTRIEGLSSSNIGKYNGDSNYLMAIYVNYEDYDFPVGAIAVIDVTTGVSKTGEFVNGKMGEDIVLEEVIRWVYSFNPKEVIIFGKSGINDKNEELILNGLRGRYVHNYMGKEYVDNFKELGKLGYQIAFFGKIFAGKYGLLSPIEYLDLENMPLATICYISLLQFACKHNENIISKVAKPEIIKLVEHLNIPYHSIKQLNIDALIGVINTCATAIGRRYFKERLMNPFVEKGKIEESYDLIDSYIKDGIFVNVQKALGGVYDLERLFRRIHLGLLHPADWIQIVESLRNLEKCPGCIEIERFKKMIDETLDLTEVPKYHLDNMSDSFFVKGVNLEIDEVKNILNDGIRYFNDLVETWNNAVNGTDIFKVDFNERDGYHILVTAKRWSTMKNIVVEKEKGKEIYSKPVSPSSSILKLSMNEFVGINDKIKEAKERLVVLVSDFYKGFLKRVSGEFEEFFKDLVKFVAETDFYSTCAKNSVQWKYVRPICLDYCGCAKSSIECNDLRHPIVERIQENIEYVTNDVILGRDTMGMLLYGINSAGKSTLMKATGIAIIMAQSGMYVPCTSMRFTPFEHVFTRIPSGDDLMKGQSTFTVEVCELRNILKRANHRSLVIGDELCSGTESISAQSIVAAGILELVRRESLFIFASHLHDLIHIKQVKSVIESGKLGVYHLSVEYDNEKKRLIYDRKLKEGQGSTIYGLEVCKSLDMGNDFIKLANEIRQELMDIDSDILSIEKRSHFNSKKYIDKICAICKHNKTEEIHHISEQHKADSNGFIKHFHKNTLHNLVETCGECHDLIHKGAIYVSGFKQTSCGIELIVHDMRKIIEESKRENVDEIQKYMIEQRGCRVTKKLIGSAIKYIKNCAKD